MGPLPVSWPDDDEERRPVQLKTNRSEGPRIPCNFRGPNPGRRENNLDARCSTGSGGSGFASKIDVLGGLGMGWAGALRREGLLGRRNGFGRPLGAPVRNHLSASGPLGKAASDPRAQPESIRRRRRRRRRRWHRRPTSIRRPEVRPRSAAQPHLAGPATCSGGRPDASRNHYKCRLGGAGDSMVREMIIFCTNPDGRRQQQWTLRLARAAARLPPGAHSTKAPPEAAPLSLPPRPLARSPPSE